LETENQNSMPDNSSDNIFASLKGLIWSAFIGVVSFQILAPNIWDYLHGSLGVGYKNAYWWFTWTYFLILPALFLIWTWWNMQSLRVCLPPFNNTEALSRHSKFFIRAVRLFIVLQSLLTIGIFYFHIDKAGVTTIMIIYFVWSALLLFFCFAYCLGCIDYYLYGADASPNSIFTDGFKNFFSYIFFKRKREKLLPDAAQRKQQKQFYRSFVQFACPAIIMLFLLFAVGFFYLNNWEASKSEKLSSKTAGDRGFALLDLKETIDAATKEIVAVQESWKQEQPAIDLSESLLRTPADHAILIDSVNGAGVDTAQAQADSAEQDTTVNPRTIAYARALNTLRKSLIQLLDTLPRSPTMGNIARDSTGEDSIKEQIDKFPIKAQIDSLNNKFKQLSLPDSINAKDLVFLEMERAVLNELSKRTEVGAQSQLGYQLRSVQAKGMMLLLSLFFTILALYIFLKMNEDIRSVQLEGMEFTKRRGDETDENKLSEMKASVADASKLSVTLWMFLTITAWLLIPIFKMVKDEEIDIRSPYKAVTFSNAENNVTSAVTGSKSKADTSYIQLGGSVSIVDTAVRHDVEEIKKKLNEIQEQVKPINNY
ncbi:MAG TPA: hypothetical protein VEV83_14535, partial [Parafilimonas sp.]|nr:hypothetical protein [Parafilimonas sp.]